MSCLGGILGMFWSFVKNFFEGHTSPPPRSAFAPPVPLCNEPGCFDRFTNLLCVNLLQQWYTCLSVATSVKISVFGGYFWRGGFAYILRKWIFYFTDFPNLFRLIVSYFFYCWFVLFVLLYFVPIVSRGGVVSLLTRWLTCHVNELPRYTLWSCHVDCGCSLKCCSLKCRRRATLFALEDLKSYHVVKLFCGRRFATLFALCVPSAVSYWSCCAVEVFAVVGLSIDAPGSVPLTLLS